MRLHNFFEFYDSCISKLLQFLICCNFPLYFKKKKFCVCFEFCVLSFKRARNCTSFRVQSLDPLQFPSSKRKNSLIGIPSIFLPLSLLVSYFRGGLKNYYFKKLNSTKNVLVLRRKGKRNEYATRGVFYLQGGWVEGEVWTEKGQH